MNPPDLKAIFGEALDRPAGPERTAFLDEACRGDPALRDRVEALLIAHEQAGSFLASPAARTETASNTPAGCPTPFPCWKKG